MKFDYHIIDAIDSVCIFWKDLEGRFLGCNKYLCQISGLLDREEIIGKLDSELPWRSEAAKLREVDQAVIRDNRCYQMQETIVMDDGSVIIFLTSKTPLVKNNKIIGIVGVSIDITEKVKLEQKLAEKEREINYIRKSNS
jgi:two-component system aerobic respiration control sensor histidine kinase ArcB